MSFKDWVRQKYVKKRQVAYLLRVEGGAVLTGYVGRSPDGEDISSVCTRQETFLLCRTRWLLSSGPHTSQTAHLICNWNYALSVPQLCETGGRRVRIWKTISFFWYKPLFNSPLKPGVKIIFKNKLIHLYSLYCRTLPMDLRDSIPCSRLLLHTLLHWRSYHP